jgi:hypothetical protein
MKALSVCQPWAWSIVHGIKTVENRWRPTSHRGPLVIHASRSRRYCRGAYSELLSGLPPSDQLDFGALIGVVDVVNCMPVADVMGQPFAEGPRCWILANARPIKPVPFKGKISLFPVSKNVIVPLNQPLNRVAKRDG